MEEVRKARMDRGAGTSDLPPPKPEPVVEVETEVEQPETESASVEKGSMGNSTVEADLSASSIGINVLPKFYIGDRFYLLGKLGMHSVDYSMKVTAMGKTTQVDKSATEVSFGGGLGYHFGNFTAQTTYEAMTVDTTSLGAINIGMQYHF